MSSIVSFSIFNGVPDGHGGQKRSWQIQELLSESAVRSIVCPFNYEARSKVRLRSKIRGLSAIPNLIGLPKFRIRDLRINDLAEKGFWAFSLQKRLGHNDAILNNASAIIWENNFPEFYHLPYFVKRRYSKRVIACPHNIEALIPQARFRGDQFRKIRFLSEEIEALRACDEVFTISEEEQWLLNLFDIPARNLPYYPLGELRDKLLQIRSYRELNVPDRFFLIVGSASNPPTRIGMTRLLGQLQMINARHNNSYSFKVVGYGTQALAAQFDDVKIEVVGYAEESVLNNYMRECKAVIVSQGYSTGALTKIPEMLVAGIPVIIDNGAARSFRRTPGLSIYSTYIELEECLHSEYYIPPVPERPEREFREFVKICRGKEGFN